VRFLMSGVNVKKIINIFLKKYREGLLKAGERETVLSKLEKLDLLWKKYKVRKVYRYGSFADESFQKYYTEF